MKSLVLVADGMDSAVFKKLSETPELNVHPDPKPNPKQILDLLPEVEGLVIRSRTTCDTEFLDRAAKLKLIIRAGEGTDNIDKNFCAERGIKVANTPGANGPSAAEHAIALMFTVLRQTAQAHQSIIDGKWEKSQFTGLELAQKTLGLVGFGRVARHVAKKLSGFDLNVLFYDPFVTEKTIGQAKKVEELSELFQKSDIISLHLPLMPKTENLINKDLMSQMKPTSILINAARGKVMVEDDLYDILKNNKIRGAGLDVFQKEPLPLSTPLRTLKNVVLTPHLGASTAEAQLRVGEMVLNQIQQYFIHGNLMNEVK